MTEAEYLAFERSREDKHEYVCGEVYPLTGFHYWHVLISGNILATLHGQLRGRDCVTLHSAMRLRCLEADSYRYPDNSVTCGDFQMIKHEDDDTLLNPTVLVEIYNSYTELTDRDQKFNEYVLIPSLQEYVLVAQDKPQVERYLRQESGDWLYNRVIGLDATLELSSIECSLSLSEIYRKIEFTKQIKN